MPVALRCPLEQQAEQRPLFVEVFLNAIEIISVFTLRAESPSIFLDKFPTYLGRSKETLLAGQSVFQNTVTIKGHRTMV